MQIVEEVVQKAESLVEAAKTEAITLATEAKAEFVEVVTAIEHKAESLENSVVSGVEERMKRLEGFAEHVEAKLAGELAEYLSGVELRLVSIRNDFEALRARIEDFNRRSGHSL